MKNCLRKNISACVFLLAVFVSTDLLAGVGDFNVEGTFEAALDLPRILYLLKKTPDGPALEFEGEFELNWAFLDTGASGILLSRETTDDMGIGIDPNGLYADVGVAGIEFFDVSESLYFGTIGYNNPDAEDQSKYLPADRAYQFQVKQTYADELLGDPYDLFGMPVMAGKTVVLDTRGPSNLEYFAADIKEANDPTIPAVDFQVALRFEKYIRPGDSNNVAPLPVLAYNPVIDNVTVEYGSISSTGTWLLDTGAMVSLISTEQAFELGLTDEYGEPIVEPNFYIPIGGIGGELEIPGYQIGDLTVPTLNGYNLVFDNARICVLDIGIKDDFTGEFIILDGVFGSNFLCASMYVDEFLLADTPFSNVVIDTQAGLMGFDVNDVYALPTCGDANHPRPAADITGDCKVNFRDLDVIAQYWLNGNCGAGNNFCDGGDLSNDGKIDYDDFAIIAGQWKEASVKSVCGDIDNPYPPGDINRDCVADDGDMRIIAAEWLNRCDALNWNCRNADLNRDGVVDESDWPSF